MKETTNKKILIAAMTLFILTFIGMQMLDYYSFNIPAPDLWIFNQSMWNTLNGEMMWNNHANASYFHDHFTPILFLILPVYGLWQTPQMLLIIQTIIITLAAMPIFYIAKFHLKDNDLALTISLLYLLYAPMQFIVMREFHAVSIAIPIMLIFYYFWITKRYFIFSVFYILAALVTEYVSIVLFMFGLYVAWKDKEYKKAALLCTFSLIYFYVAIFVVIAHFNPDQVYYGFTILNDLFGVQKWT